MQYLGKESIGVKEFQSIYCDIRCSNSENKEKTEAAYLGKKE